MKVIQIPLPAFVRAYREYRHLQRAAWRAAGRLDFRLKPEDVNVLAHIVALAEIRPGAVYTISRYL